MSISFLPERACPFIAPYQYQCSLDPGGELFVIGWHLPAACSLPVRRYANCVLDEFIRKLSIAGDLSEADRTAASSLPTVTERVARGHVLPRRQDGGVVRILTAGWAYRSTTLRNGARQITAFLLPGDICTPTGFSAVVERQEICAATDVQVACIPAELIRAFARRPDIAEALRLGDLADAAILQEWIVNLTRRSAIPRTAHLVLELETRLAMRGNATRGEFELPLTQAVLGDALGLSSVHLNRTIRRLREEELLVFGGGRMVIRDRPRLVRVAEFDAKYLNPTVRCKQDDDNFSMSGQ